MLKRTSLFLVTLTILITCLTPPLLFGRTSLDFGNVKGKTPSITTSGELYCTVQHEIGRIVLGVSNYGTLGDNAAFALGGGINCFTNEITTIACEFPKNSRQNYLFAGAFWVGAVVGRDTLVSIGADGWDRPDQNFHPSDKKSEQMRKLSIIDPTSDEFTGAKAEEQYVAIYTDTSGTGAGQDRVRPLMIKIVQTSYAWSYPYAEDFVLFDYTITNMGDDALQDIYMGLYVDGDVILEGASGGWDNDICGFLKTYPTEYRGCNWLDTVNIAWIADSDGRLGGVGSDAPLQHVTGTRIIRTPADKSDEDTLRISFNWWVSNSAPALDFGPRKKSDSRDLGTGGQGTPANLTNKYYFLQNGEFDYNQTYTASILPSDTTWLYPPPALAKNISNGYDTRYLLSFGPFNLTSGQELPLTFAYVAGENLHVNKNNLKNNLSDANYDPVAYNANLDFSDLAKNSLWASWIYDTPGFDSDGDEYKGKFRLCYHDSLLNIDTIIDETTIPFDTTIDSSWEYELPEEVYYEGDGVPDFIGASPPPAPEMWLIPGSGRIKVRWNGRKSETTKDVFADAFDFEGYRVYLALDDREDSYSMLASYDREDYNKYVYNPSTGLWRLNDNPYTIEELRCYYGESCNDLSFTPEHFTQTSPYFVDGSDSILAFLPQDYNQSILGVTTPIKKIYPHQPFPSSNDPDSVDASELTTDGYLKYYEYEFLIENLLSTIPYNIAVTAFDYGSPQSDLESLESPRSFTNTEGYATSSAATVLSEGLEVFVYPNPYYGDGRYFEVGFEGRESKDVQPVQERIRRLNFGNLPPKCTISIFSLDGDLIREIEHDMDPNDPASGQDYWNMITRNTQAVVSGIYYWTVQDQNGNTQIGKFVVIL